MLWKHIKISRADLYERVWAAPVRTVAAEIGISDSALGLAIKAANIPRPPRGYFLMSADRQPRKPPLPSAPKGQEMVHLTAMDQSALPDAMRKEVAERAVEPIAVEAELKRPHHLVAATRAAWARGDDRYMPRTGLDVRVYPESRDRALRILDAVIKASERLGDRWEVTEGDTIVTVGRQRLKVALTERGRQVAVPPKPLPARATAYERLLADRNRTEWVGTGELTLSLDVHTLGPTRKKWADTPSAKLESKLAEFLTLLPAIAHSVAQWQAVLDEGVRKRAEESQKRKLTHEQAMESHQRLLNLQAATERHSNASAIRALCEALRASSPDQALESWIAWAENAANELDPAHRNNQAALTNGREAKPAGRPWWPEPVPKPYWQD